MKMKIMQDDKGKYIALVLHDRQGRLDKVIRYVEKFVKDIAKSPPRCLDCNGVGVTQDLETCKTCDGYGYADLVERYGLDEAPMAPGAGRDMCPRCKERIKRIDDKYCVHCTKRVSDDEID